MHLIVCGSEVGARALPSPPPSHAMARGWDPAAVDCMMREVEESTEMLLPAAEQVLRELEEEARANWEERAIHQATQVTNLAGEAFETLSENRWSRRDCLEYQEELDWAMRIFRRICNMWKKKTSIFGFFAGLFG
jgi:hypothetical protein